MDPLSDVLSLLKPRSYVSAGFDAGEPWAVAFAHNVGIKCYAVVSGACWLVVDGVPAPVRLTAGDCFLLPGGRAFRLTSDPALPAVESSTVFGAARAGNTVIHNGGGAVFLMGSRFVLSGSHADMLLAMLPPVVHIRKESEQAALRWSVERMMQELQDQQPGSLLIAEHLAHMMLVQALRLHMRHHVEGGEGVGWLFALADRQMGAAIGAMHADPARRWTLAALAGHVHMSRSSFALKFRRMVGMPAMDYLTRWRMLLAGDRLRHTSEPISLIAPALGYASESAFSTAFKRVMGCAPRHYHRGGAAAAGNTEAEA